ncbi:type I methionyl aminopeptidase [bacterium]|nr:type I methionyl aminopeptidase [bacterium]
MIIIKSEQEIDTMRDACKIAAGVIDLLKDKIEAGISTDYLDKMAEKFILKHKAEPAFKGYKGYPKTTCISINNEVVHGIPSKKRIIQEGDLVSVDVGALKNGYYGDTAYTYCVGNITDEAKKLVAVTKKSLKIGINQFTEANRLFSISASIQEYVEKNGYSIVRDYVGHGIGKNLHEEPQIPNFGEDNTGPRLKVGMVFAIEPMVNAGSCETVVLNDGWTVKTKDGSLSAHFEHTVALTKNGVEILTNG